MRKRVFSILLSIAVCLSMMPVGAWANNTGGGIADEVKTVSNENSEKGISLFSNNVAEVTIGENVTQYADIDAAFTAAQEATSADVKLLQNVTIDKTNNYGINLKKGSITLNLNGKSLSMKDTGSFYPLSAVFYMGGDSRLTINDSGSGKIVQPNPGPAVYLSGDSTLIINSGTIENTSEKEPARDDYKCAVFVKGGDVTVNGGTIGTSGSEGDGLSYAYGTAILNGGTFKKVEIIKNLMQQDINQDVTVSNLLGAGRSYRYTDGSSPDSYDVDALDNVSVVEGKIPIKYQRYESFVFESASADTYTDVTADTVNWTEGVYVVTGDVNIDGNVTVTGKTELILRDGASLTVNGCLSLASNAGGKGLTIYGQTSQTGTMSIVNDNGYALNFSDGDGNVNLHVYGGSFSAKGSPYAVSNNSSGSSVFVYRATGWKAVADGSAVTDGSFRDKQSFTVEKCTELEHEWVYSYDDERNTNIHYKGCRLCSSDGGAETHSASRYECKDNSEHTEYCDCGKEIGTAEHETKVAVNDDGLTHKTACKSCSYAAEDETHTFENGSCTGCGAKLAAEYDGRKYASLQKAIDAAAAAGNGTVTLAADKIEENVTVTGGNIIIDLNGKKWTADITNGSTCIPLTVDGGSVTLKNGKLHQEKSGSSARSAIVMHSGSLTLESDVSVMAGASGIEEVRCYSVDLQGGSLTLNQGAALLTGMKVSDGHTLSEYLPAGSAFVKCEYTEESGVQISNPIEYVKDAYTANEYTGAMAVTAHTHRGVSCACGFVCDHSAINEAGYCSQCQMTFEAKNDSTYYESLADALSEATDGETVTLLKDIALSADTTLDGDKTVKLDLRSKKIDSAGEALKLITIGEGTTLAVSNTKIDSQSSNVEPLDITFKVKSGGMLDLCPAGKVTDDTYKGTVSCVKLAGGGAFRSFKAEINSLELTEPYNNYDVKLIHQKYVYSKINRISSGSDTLTAGELLKKNHEGCVLYGKNNGTGATVPNTTLIKGMSSWTELYVQECYHEDEDRNAVCDYCSAELFVKVEAKYGETGAPKKYFTLESELGSNGYAEAVSALNNQLAGDGYTDRQMTLLRDVPDNVKLFLKGDFTLTGKYEDKDVTVNSDVDVQSGANIIFHRGSYKGNVYVNGSATVKGFTVFDVGGSVTVGRSGELTTMSNSSFDKMVVSGTLKSKGGNFGSVTFEESSKGELEWGSFSSMEIKGERNLNSLLKGQKAYFDKTTDTVVSGAVTSLSGVYIKEHTHKFAGSNPCACGYTCEHEIDSNGVCSKCKTQFAATVTIGSDTEYVTDIYDAFTAAGNGSTIRLLADTSLDKSFEFTAGDVILDLNGKALTVYSGKTVTVSEGGKVQLSDSVGTGSMTYIAANGGELNITGGSVTKLDVKKAKNISISGGSFGSIVNSTGEYFNLGILMADGYAFKQDETFKKQGDTVYKDATVENLTVAQCVDGEHDSIYSHDGYICAYCNKKIAAGIGNGVIRYYADLGNAIADADCDKYRGVTISSDITLDKPIIINKSNNSMNKLYIDLAKYKVSSGAGFSGSMFTVEAGYIVFRDSSGGSIEAEDADGITVTGGSLEVESGSIVASSAGCAAIRLKGGKLNVSTGIVSSSGDAYAVIAEDGDELLIKADKNFGKLKIAATYKGTVSLKTGTYSSIETAGGKFKTVNDLLAESYGFADADTGNAVGGNTAKVENVKIVHRHIYNDEGLCTAGEDYYWAKAKITGTGDSSSDRFYDTLEEALQTAEEHAGCRVTVWSNADLKNTVTVSKGEFTIDFRHDIGSIRGFNSDWIGSVLKIAGGNIEITGDDDCGIFSQGKENTALEISGGTVTVTGGCFKNNSGEGNNIIYLNGGTLILQGGTFVNYAGAVFKTEPSDFGSLLGTGYAYADENGNLMKPGDMKNDIKIFKVVECTDHQPAADGRCIYCEEKCVAEVVSGETVTKYIDLNKALEAAKANEGAVVKLLDDITGGASSDGSVILDLNGKTVDKVEITDGTLTVSGSGSINALNIKNGALDISDNSVRIDALTAAENGSAALTAGTFGSISVSEGRKIAELLAPEYSYQIGDGWASIEQRESDSLTGDITVAKTPITSLTVTADNESVIYGYKNAPKLTAVPVLADGAKATYKWYTVTDGKAEEIKGAADAEYTVGEGLDKGTYTFRCEVTADGYTISEEAAVAVNEKVIDNDSVEFKLSSGLTYNGSVQEPDFTITVDGRELVKGTDYDVTYSDELRNAGEYTATIAGKGNYSGTVTQRITISQMKIRPETPDAAAVNRAYNGKTEADLNSVEFKNTDNGSKVSLADVDYEISGARFDSAGAGERKSLIFTVTLKNPNYILALAGGGLVTEEEYEFDNYGYTIFKAVAPANPADVDIVQKYTDKAEKKTSVADADMPKDAGTITYAKGTDAEIKNIAEWNVASDGSVTYTLSGGNAGDVITLPVTIGSDNYENVTANIVITLIDKDVPAVTAEDMTVTYDGKAVSADKIRGTAKFDGRTVAGKWNWKAGTKVTDVADSGEKTVIFTPDDIDTYAAVEKNIRVTINRADVKGGPEYTAISESGKTLADANIAVKDKDGKDKFSVAGTVKWEAADTTEVKQGEKYKWIFTPTDTANYNTLTGEITLWPYPAGGGIVAPADEDVITVEDKTSSETTTKTTVKDTKTETVKNEQGEEISKVTATVSEKVAEKLVDQAVSNKSDTVEITVKSNDGNKAEQTEIEIPKKTVESIAKDTDADLVIKTDNGQVVLDNKTLETIAAAAEGDTVRIVVNENTQLKENQKPASDVIGKNGKLFDIKAVIGDRVIHDFKGGKAHVTLPMPEKLKGKDIVIIYINDKGICEILNHTMETVGADEYIKFTTSHFSNFAVVEKADAEKIIEKQNVDKINSLIKEAKLKAATSRTSKKNVKVKISGVKNLNSLIKEAKAMGYTVKYKFYKSTKKASKYKAVKTKTSNSYINTKGKKGTRYYYKVKVMVYDGKKLVAQSALKQCSYGVRRWSKSK